MNISSEIFPTDGSNSSDQLFSNTTEEEIVFKIFSTAHIVLGVPINTFVIWLIVTGTAKGLAAEFFTLNISICEMFYCIESLFLILSNKFKILWTAVYFLDGIASTSRPLFQCLICVERYLAVVHPVTFLKFKPLKYRVSCSVFAWSAGLGSSLFSMIYFLSQIYAFNWLVQFILFLSIQLFCCVAVLRVLKQSGPGERGRERKEENHMKRRAFNLILITTVSMVIIYAPVIVTTILDILTQVIGFSSISYICYVLGGFVQPVLYLHRIGKLYCFCSQSLLATGKY